MYTQEAIKEAGLDDFRVFLRQVWDFLGLPPPTPVQNAIAYLLQHGPRRLILAAFRGVGKSWITVAFVLWLLFLNPQLKVMVVSASQPLADDFSKFAKQLIHGMPLLQHLAPRPRSSHQSDSSVRFDVGPARESKDPSVKSAGITGQITGNRADVIVVDDVEIPKNSYTHLLRERLSELVKEFDSVLKPGGRIIYLGTPQIEASLYTRLLTRGYEMHVFPVRVPEKVDAYHGRLADWVMRQVQRGLPALSPLEPNRFPQSEIAERLASYGASGFALQFMLDTNPASAEKYPLKTRDLLVHDCDPEMGYVKLVWGAARDQMINDLLSGGLEGDCYVSPAWRSDEMAPYTGTVMAIDPSGRGSDETAYAIVRNLHGMLYLVDSGGYLDGFAEATLEALAAKAVRHRVNYVIIEDNYGGGMFRQLLKPVMQRVAQDAKLNPSNPDPLARPPSFDEEFNQWSTTQKELRILDTLQPLMQSHRLVIDRKVIERDLEVQNDNLQYSLIQQMTRMARIKGCLAHEDRLEALSMACSYWTERVKIDKDKALVNHKQALLDKELRRFMDHAITLRATSGGRASTHEHFYRWRPSLK